MSDAEAIARNRFIKAVAEGDLNDAYEWLIVLRDCCAAESETQMYEWLVAAHQHAEDTCEEHGVFCCPECFDFSEPGPELFESGDPADDLGSGALALEVQVELGEIKVQYWDAEVQSILKTVRKIHELPEATKVEHDHSGHCSLHLRRMGDELIEETICKCGKVTQVNSRGHYAPLPIWQWRPPSSS